MSSFTAFKSTRGQREGQFLSQRNREGWGGALRTARLKTRKPGEASPTATSRRPRFSQGVKTPEFYSSHIAFHAQQAAGKRLKGLLVSGKGRRAAMYTSSARTVPADHRLCSRPRRPGTARRGDQPEQLPYTQPVLARGRWKCRSHLLEGSNRSTRMDRKHRLRRPPLPASER